MAYGNNNNGSYPNSGALFPRQKKTEKSPDMGGDFTLNGEVLQYVLDCAQRGAPVKLEIVGRRRMGRNNMSFISLNVNTPYEERGGGQRNGQPQGYPNRGNPPAYSQQRQPQQNSYAAQRGGMAEPSRQQRNDQFDDSFERGDRMPSFGGEKAPWDD